jgi:hypothetical protein
MGPSPRTLALLAGATLSLTSALSSAQTAGNQAAIAADLFKRAKTLMGENNFAEACPLLEQSQAMSPGTGTLLNLALCHEKQGKLATAWGEFNQVKTLATNSNPPRLDRATFAAEHAATIEPHLSRLTIDVKGQSATAPVQVELDGMKLDPILWNTPLPVDPGDHRIAAEAKGKVPEAKVVKVGADADKVVVQVGPLVDEVPAPTLPKVAAGSAVGSDGSSTMAPTSGARGARGDQATADAHSSSSTKTWGYALLATGGAGVVIGAVCGLQAYSLHSTYDAEKKDFDSKVSAKAPDADTELRAGRWATGSNLGFGLGLAGIAAGTFLVLYNPHTPPAARGALGAPASRSVSLTPTMGGPSSGLVLSGTW